MSNLVGTIFKVKKNRTSNDKKGLSSVQVSEVSVETFYYIITKHLVLKEKKNKTIQSNS